LSGDKQMWIFKAFDTRELEEFATGLATDLGRRFPPASEARTDPGVQHQVNVILEGLAARAVRYREQHRLGIYRKAKLGNIFRWKLKELGYSPAFIQRATRQIVTRLAVK
jgi:hypothetical protein